jgi:hypothetical protein
VLLLVADKILEEPEVKKIHEGYPGQFGETLLELASLKVLGRDPVIRYPEFARVPRAESKDQPPEIHADAHMMRKWGTVGFRYHNEGEHGNHGNAGIVHRGEPDVDMAGRVLVKCAELTLPVLESFSRYEEWLAKRPFAFITPDKEP